MFAQSFLSVLGPRCVGCPMCDVHGFVVVRSLCTCFPRHLQRTNPFVAVGPCHAAAFQVFLFTLHTMTDRHRFKEGNFIRFHSVVVFATRALSIVARKQLTPRRASDMFRSGFADFHARGCSDSACPKQASGVSSICHVPQVFAWAGTLHRS